MGKLLLIASANTNSGDSSISMQFTNITNTYTDLLLLGSLRGTNGSIALNARVYLNNQQSAVYSGQRIQTSGTTMSSSQLTSQSQSQFNIPGSNSVSTHWSNTFIYIPNYKNTIQERTFSIDSQAIPTSNSTSRSVSISSWRYANSSATTQIDVFVEAGQIAQYSTLYLYGVDWTP